MWQRSLLRLPSRSIFLVIVLRWFLRWPGSPVPAPIDAVSAVLGPDVMFWCLSSDAEVWKGAANRAATPRMAAIIGCDSGTELDLRSSVAENEGHKARFQRESSRPDEHGPLLLRTDWNFV